MDMENIIVQSVIDSLRGNMEVTNPFPQSIFMAPSTLRNLSPDSFKPRVVSIGPLHREDENLKPFEGQKGSFVSNLLFRSTKQTQTLTQLLTSCVEKVVASIEKIKQCYADIKTYDDIELATMMVMDASFILEFVYLISDVEYSGSRFMFYDSYIPYDLLLLENQVPFFVLNIIFECTVLHFEAYASLTEFIHPLLKYPSLFQGKLKLASSREYTKYDHILGYLHACYNPRVDIPSYFPSSTIYSAVELERAGVKFMPNHSSKWPLAMEVKMYRRSCIFWFSSEPTLRMPPLRINQYTELVLRNLIAYEQLSTVRPYTTSYATNMDMLINTHEDIATLVTSKVIDNHLGSNEEAANMIKGICKEVVCKQFYYGEEWERLDSHFNGYWSRKIVKLRRTYSDFKRTYFSSPWNIIGLFAVIILFFLTVVQTIFTVKSAGK